MIQNHFVYLQAAGRMMEAVSFYKKAFKMSAAVATSYGCPPWRTGVEIDVRICGKAYEYRDRQTYRQMKRLTGVAFIDRRTDRYTERQTQEWTDGRPGRQADGQTDTQKDRRKDGRTDGRAGRQTKYNCSVLV